MIKIIKKGKYNRLIRTYNFVCPNCECEFEFLEEDVYVASNNFYFRCPCCELTWCKSKDELQSRIEVEENESNKH